MDATVDTSERFMDVAARLPTLYHLDDQMAALVALLDYAVDRSCERCKAQPDTAGPDCPDCNGLSREAVEAHIALLEEKLLVRVESYVSAIRTLESISAMRDAEAEKLEASAARSKRAAARMKQRLLEHIVANGRKPIVTARGTVSVRRNPPSIQVLEERLVPASFLRHVPEKWEVNKVAILENWRQTGGDKGGQLPPGVELARSERLDIS